MVLRDELDCLNQFHILIFFLNFIKPHKFYMEDLYQWFGTACVSPHRLVFGCKVVLLEGKLNFLKGRIFFRNFIFFLGKKHKKRPAA